MLTAVLLSSTSPPWMSVSHTRYSFFLMLSFLCCCYTSEGAKLELEFEPVSPASPFPCLISFLMFLTRSGYSDTRSFWPSVFHLIYCYLPILWCYFSFCILIFALIHLCINFLFPLVSASSWSAFNWSFHMLLRSTGLLWAWGSPGSAPTFCSLVHI